MRICMELLYETYIRNIYTFYANLSGIALRLQAQSNAE